ncbi:hypothetical protein [Nocardia cyriacigeorgica]|uniref:hypothetical protein n=1 Tax=Nocardia cyriacigeorgica TaxID=135487 RepID=UPI0024562AAA|nr:hypothetical protein [Nocardia cyriacigeorgica]
MTLPPQVIAPLAQLLSYLAWFVLLLCVGRAIFVAALLAFRTYREESTEGLIGSLSAATLLGSASGIAAAVLPT